MNKLTWLCSVVVLAAANVACGDTYETTNNYIVEGQAGAAGSSAQAGSGGSAGAVQDTGHEAAAGSGGEAGSAGAAGQAGSLQGGAAGSSGAAGSGGTQNLGGIKAQTKVGYENSEAQIIVPTPTPDGHIGDMVGYAEILLTNDADSVPIKIVGAKICQVNPDGDAADFERVSLNWAGDEIVFANVRDGECWNLFPNGSKWTMPPGGGNLIWTAVKVAKPLSNAEAGGAWHGVPRSGHVSILRLTELKLESLDGTSSLTLTPNHESSALTLRAGVVSFLQDDLPSTLLVDGAETVIHRTEALIHHQVGLRHLEVSVEKSLGFKLTDFRLYRCDVFFANCAPVPQGQVKINTYCDMANGVLDYIREGDLGAPVNIEFLAEEVLLNDGYYQLTAVPSGVKSGDYLETYYWKSLNSGVVTGQLGPMTYGTFSLHANGFNSIGPVIWSDLSEKTDHNPAVYGSADYTNDFQVRFGFESLNPQTKLVAP